jgi:hypothetical protein
LDGLHISTFRPFLRVATPVPLGAGGVNAVGAAVLILTTYHAGAVLSSTPAERAGEEVNLILVGVGLLIVVTIEMQGGILPVNM